MNISQPCKTMENKLTQIGLILLLTIFASLLQAQETDTIVPVDKNPENLLRKIDPKEIVQSRFNYWEDKFKGHWAGIDFGFNTFLNEDYSDYEGDFMDNDFSRSNSAYLNLIQHNIGLQRNLNTIGLVTGLGLHLESYRLDKNTTITQAESGKIIPDTLYFDQNQKSKLSIVSLMIPLMAEFQIPISHYENRLYFATGAYMGIRLSSHTKIKYRVDRKEKLKVPGSYALQDYRFGLMFRTGYRWINLFATYELTPLFSENKGPGLHTFTVGLTLLSF